MSNVSEQPGPIMIGDVDVSSWTEEERKTLLDIQSAIDADSDVMKQIVADNQSPANKIKAKMREAELVKLFREDVETASVENLVYDGLVRKHGLRRISRVSTKGGMVVVRCPTEEEATTLTISASGATDEMVKADIVRDYIVKLTLHPSQDRVREIGALHPGLWVILDNMIGLLSSARAGDVAPLG